MSGRVVSALRTAGRVAATTLSALTVISLFVMLEALETRKVIRSRQPPVEPRASGIVGADRPGEPLPLAMLGDSLAVGVGAGDPEHTVGAILARRLAAALRRPIELSNVAVTGSRSRQLGAQLGRLARLTDRRGVAIIVIGGNDILAQTNIAQAARDLYRAVVDLRHAGWKVVVASCPDMGTVRPLIQPLRYVARRTSRALARAQNLVTLRAGGRTVPLGVTLGPIFRHRPRTMFAGDHFHPSAAGYARAAAVLMPTVLSAASQALVEDALS